MDEACGHTPDLGLDQDYSPHRVQATPKRSTNPIDNVAGQLYNCHQYRTPTTDRLIYNDAGPTTSLHSPSSGGNQMPGGIPGAPRLHTPVSGGSSRRGLLTPRHMTPQGKMQVYNPFESPLMDRLHDQLDFSPNMFVETIPEEKSPEKFCWSIDQIATLQPADIEEKEIETQCKYYYQNREHDVKAQRAIDEYFSSQNHIAPSPWSASSKKKVHELPRTPGVHSAESPMVLQIKPSGLRNKDITLLKEAGSQTELTLPKDFDLQKVLGDHYCKVNASGEAQQGDEEGAADNLSSSSLRRKLFFQGGKNSPFNPNTEADLTLSPKLSPQLSPAFTRKTPLKEQLMASGMETPGSNLFSSSPIHGHEGREVGPMHFMTPSLRRCSTAPQIADSPEFSPIVLSSKDLQHTPSSSSLVQCTPQSCRPTKTIRSPGMSPIVGAEGSFMSSSQCTRSSRRHGTDPKMRLPFQDEESDLKDDSIQQMDFDEDKTPDHHFNTQDTGYQTNSLQSTNMDAVSSSNITGFDPVLPHSNLTVQFGNMCGSDTGIEEKENPPPIPRKVTSLISPTFTFIKNHEPHAENFSALSDYSGVGGVAMPYVRPRATRVPVFPWKPDMLKTKSAVIKEKITGDDPNGSTANSLPASEVARLALMRAGEDYDKFCVQKLYSHHDSPLKSGVESMSFDL